MSVVPYENGSRSWVQLMAPAIELAKHVSDTQFVPKGLRGNPAGIVAAIMYGDELGIGPMQALAKIAVIEGRPTLAAEAQRALILAAGHDIWITEQTATKVTVAGRRSNSEHTTTVTWTLDDAKRAGLAGRNNWRSYPRQMLTARATAELARLIFADAVGGIAATEELEEGDELPAEVEAPRGPKRKRRSTSNPETTLRVAKPSSLEIEMPPLPDEPISDTHVDLEPAPVPVESEAATIHESPPSGEAASEATGALPSPRRVGGTVIGGGAPARDLKPTKRQLEKLNLLVGTLRDREQAITTEQLYSALARARNIDVSDMVDVIPDAYDPFGVLHWSPLRETLVRAEASDLIDRLERLEANLAMAQ